MGLARYLVAVDRAITTVATAMETAGLEMPSVRAAMAPGVFNITRVTVAARYRVLMVGTAPILEFSRIAVQGCFWF